MINPALTEYISKLKEAKIHDSTIKENLIKSGWPESEIHAAFLPPAPSPVNIPVPPIPRYSMWISFEYVLLFITMWVWTAAMGGVWNYAINKYVPDELSNSFSLTGLYGTYMLQGYLSAIIVAFPFFLLLFASLSKQTKENPGIKNIKTRKFLIYFTVVVNFLVMISHLISTVFGFLGATMSTRTVPHLLVSLIISGSICLILLQEVREDRK